MKTTAALRLTLAAALPTLALLPAARAGGLPADPAVGALTLEPTRSLLGPPRVPSRWEQAEAQRQAARLTADQAANANADLLAARSEESTPVFASPDAFNAAPAARPALEDRTGDDPAASAPAAADADLYPAPSVTDLAVRWDPAFAADGLAAPGRTRLASEAAATALGENGTLPAAPAFAGPGGAGTSVVSAERVTATSRLEAAGGSETGTSPLAAGPQTAAALTPSGAAYAFGNNEYGQLGNNSTTSSKVPVAVSSANGFTNAGVTAVAAGEFHSLAVQNGAVYAWGYNNYGQLGNNSTTNSSLPVAVSSANGFTNAGVTAVAAGAFHSLAVQNGVVYAWGYNNDGELGNNTANESNVPVKVSSANGFTNTGVTAVAAGDSHSLAVQNGAVYAWGYNVDGQLGNNSTTSSHVPVAVLNLSTGVTAVAGGYDHSLAVQNGNVFAWGYNNYGQLGNNSTTNSKVPVEVSYSGSVLSGIVQVAAGQYSSYALSSDGSLYVWGFDGYGQLGDGGTTEQNSPEHLLPPSGEFYQLISSNNEATFALAILGDTPVPEPATSLAGALTVAAAGCTLRRRLRRA